MKLGSTDISKVYLGSTEVAKAYLGDTLVFDSIPPEPLPSGAQRIEYLQGDKTAYIKIASADFPSGTLVSIDFEFMVTESSSWALFGAWSTTSAVYPSFSIDGYNGGRFYASDTDSTRYIYSSMGFSSAGNWNKFEFKNGNIIINGTVKRSNVSLAVAINRFMAIFGLNTGQTNLNKSSVRIKHFKVVTENASIDLIPARIESVGYLYDRVTQTFYGNEYSSGAFILGNDV